MTYRYSSAFIVALLFSFFFQLLVSADDWTKWLGPSENGISAEALPGEVSLDQIAWEAVVGIGFSSFSIAQGRVFTMGYADGSETIWCFSEKDGKVLWSHSYPAELMPNLHEGGPNATPTIDQDRVYAMSKDGQLHCCSIADGKVIWQKNMLKESGMYRAPEWGYGASPYIFNDWVVIESGATFAYDKLSGKEIWRSESYRPAYGSPKRFKMGEKDFLAILKTDGLVVLDPADGRTLGFHQWRTSFQTNATTPIDVGGGKLFISTGYDRGCSLLQFDGEKLNQIFETQTMSNHMGNSVLLDNHFYGFDGTAHRGRPVEFCCISASDGTKKWSTQEFKYGSVIAAGKELIVLTEGGEMLIGPASTVGFVPKIRKQILEGRCWTSPAFANGRIYARNAAGKVVVLEVKK